MSQSRAISLGVLGVALVGVADALVGYEISLVALHMAPVLLVTWFASWRWGVFILVLMTLMSILSLLYVVPESPRSHLRYLDIGSDFLAIGFLILIQARLRSAYHKVRQQARTDGLTHCLNRSGFHEQLQAEVARQKRYGHAFALMVMDVDDFKALNDTLGHHAGDALLAEVGRALRARLRRTDSAGRLGGDEFAVLLRESDPQAAERAARQLKQELERLARGHGWAVGFSIGAVCFTRAPENADTALQHADALMYDVKKSGKNALRVSSY